LRNCDDLTRVVVPFWGHVARFLKLSINQLLNSVGSQTHEASFGLAGGDGFADLEAPFPRARLDLHKGEINALAVDDFARGKDASLTYSFANNFESTLRPDSVHASARRVLKRARFSR
jgi:hypothetical protein